jgi:uncharacterized NAD(P)/FAD-binding protein YdhS
MQTITIIGGGFSGTAVLLQLLKNHDGRELNVNLIEKRKSSGIGIAYSTTSDQHLLNVPAGRMGAYADDAEHFIKWLQANGHSYSAKDFVPRKIYCAYLNSIQEEAISNKKSTFTLNRINDEAIGLTTTVDGYGITLKSGNMLSSQKVVLALGNFPPSNPYLRDMSYTQCERYHYNPWANGQLSRLNDNDKILIIGSGLTMVDMIADLHHKAFKGEVVAISRHGYVPFVHKGFDKYSIDEEALKNAKTIQEVFNTVRSHHRLAKKQNINWRGVIDSLRPHTQTIWKNLSLPERKKFLRHLNSLWNVVRHRIPPSSADAIDKMKAGGQLKIYPAKLIRLIPSANNIHVMFRIRKTKQIIASDFSYVFNCTGPHSNFKRISDPLVQQLLTEGIIQTDPLNLGLNASPEGRIIHNDGTVSQKLFTLGPSLKGILGESTAVPEIRVQAEGIAKMLLAP